jgi:integrative and conjugative element protein (TIGR02256 family)
MFGLLEDAIRNVKNVFRLHNRGRIKISNNAIEIMASYVQDDNLKEEAGGVLLGRFIAFSKDIVIDEVTEPILEDHKSRHSFIRNKKHQETVERLWRKSNGTVNYLGEWHTHPEAYPSPSNKDLKSWKEKLKSATFSSRYLYFIIYGTKAYGIWEGDRRTLKINRINN